MEENRGGESPDAAADYKCGGKSEMFSGVPHSVEDSTRQSRCSDTRALASLIECPNNFWIVEYSGV